MAWTVACAVEATRGRPILPVTVAGRQLVIVRDGPDLHAFDRACPHEQADLADGRCAEGRLHCPRHLASFRLQDGEVSSGWSFPALRRYRLRLEDELVMVDLADEAGRA